MSRQYFADVLVDPPLLNPNAAAITATTETGLWPVALFTPIAIGDIKAGKIYKCMAGGIFSTSASASTLTLTPRVGTTTSGITLGASVAQTVPASLTNEAWFIQFVFVIRTVGLAGTNSTAMGEGFFTGGGAAATAASETGVVFGGTSASFDASIAQGFFLGWTLSVAGSCTPHWVTWQSLN